MAPMIPSREGPSCFIVSTKLLTGFAFMSCLVRLRQASLGRLRDKEFTGGYAIFMPVTCEKRR